MDEQTNVTIHDVAREADVSFVTVSKVLNNKNVRPSTRKRVLDAVEKLGYVPNMHARSLAGVQSKTVAVLIDHLRGGFYTEILSGIDEALAESEYDLILFTTRRLPQNEAKYASMVTQGIAQGVIIVIPRLSHTYLEDLRNQNVPHVLAVCEEEDRNSFTVGVTNRQGGYTATEHLIKLGHQKIAHIGVGKDWQGATFERMQGYKAALADYNLPFNPDFVPNTPFHASREAFYNTTQQLLRHENRPSAIFATTDNIAFTVMDAARDMGLQVPDDLSVVGFDNIPEANIVHPTLTTVEQHLSEIGRQAALALLETINHPSGPSRRIELATELVLRNSTCPPKERR